MTTELGIAPKTLAPMRVGGQAIRGFWHQAVEQMVHPRVRTLYMGE